MRKSGNVLLTAISLSIIFVTLFCFIGCGNEELFLSIQAEVLGINFSASPTSGVARLTVNFTDTSSGEASSWEWDFDNDGTIDSTEQNPTYRYHSPGTYSVRLRTRVHGATASLLKSDLIQVTLGTPEKHTVINIFPDVSAIAVADIDGDGANDVVGGAESTLADQSTEALRWFRNIDGLGTQWGSFNIDLNSEPYALHTVDLDKDNDIDIVIAGDDTGVGSFWDTRWWENADGDGSSWTAHDIGMAGGDKAVFVADLDNDGSINVVSAGWGGDRITWFDYTGSEPWDGYDVTEGSMDNYCPHAKSVVAAHIDNDQYLDVLAMGADAIRWWKNPNSHTFWTVHDISGDYDSDVSIAYSVQAADVDGDGDNDALSSTPGNNWSVPSYDGELVWWENVAGDGSSWQRRVIDAEVNGASLYPADIDGDGDIDVLGVGSNYDFQQSPPVPTESYIAWWENADGLGTSWVEHPVETDSSYNRASAALVADVDSDGDLDVLAALPNYDYTDPYNPVPAGGYIAWWEILQ